jgi:hypothetical protein
MSVPKSVAKLVDRRDGKCCVRCGAYAEGGSRHHRLLKSRGGQDTADNLILLCGSGTTGCHGWVHANPSYATEFGYMVSSGTRPAERAVWHPGLQRDVWLSAEGHYLVQPYGAVIA